MGLWSRKDVPNVLPVGIKACGPFRYNWLLGWPHEHWDHWSFIHMFGVFWISIIAYFKPSFNWIWIPPLTGYFWAFLWDVVDGFKPLYIEWPHLRPKWINQTIWNRLGMVFASDGFSFHDVLYPDVLGAVWAAMYIYGGFADWFPLGVMGIATMGAIYFAYTSEVK